MFPFLYGHCVNTLYKLGKTETVGKGYAINIEAEKLYFYCRRKPKFGREEQK